MTGATRSAEAGILGFTYQFLQTAIKILSLDEPSASFTIEGIEDLDISTSEEDSLVQYKYHEAKSFTLSAIDKPIALMFKHFLDKGQKTPDFYVLFSYFGVKNEKDSLKNIVTINGKDELETLLGYANASKILSGLEWHNTNLDDFLKILRFEKAENFDTAKDKLLDLIKDNFKVSEEVSQALYFTNAIYFINNLATKKNILERKISKQQFIDFLHSNSQIVQYEIIRRLYGKKEYLKYLRKYFKSKNLKRNVVSYVVHLKDINGDTPRFITDLAKKFIVDGATRDTLPISFIINDKVENLINLKKTLLEINFREQSNLIFNDGQEFYYFQPTLFSCRPLLYIAKNGNKIDKASYNYRLISFETYFNNKSNINLVNPFHFIIDNSVEAPDLSMGFPINYLNISNIDDIDLLQLLGG